MRKRSALFSIVAASLTATGIASRAYANPQGGQVVGGSATIAGQGTPGVIVTQSSSSAIVNWQSFNIGAGETTQFIQPSAASVILNRVTGSQNPSSIYGTLSANGRVFLVNPEGFIFGPGSVINTAGFLATTHDIKNEDFLAGHYLFNIAGNPRASIINQGTITVADTGIAALVAPAVRNDGIITARLGKIALGSGNGFTLDLYGDNLITFALNDAVASQVIDVTTGKPVKSLVSNTGKLSADGGTVALTAVTARALVDSVINNGGVVEARSVGLQNGRIVLGAQTAKTKLAKDPSQNVIASGTLDVSGKGSRESGGTAQITGEDIVLQGVAIDASGTNGGGKILVGGDYGGGSSNGLAVAKYGQSLEAAPVPTSTSVVVDTASILNASALTAGDGGKVVVWSDGSTSVKGTIIAEGGSQTGNGGFIETSGPALDIVGAYVRTEATNSYSGMWLLDPDDVTIDAAEAATIEDGLEIGNVTVATNLNATGGNGDIIVDTPVNWSSNHVLTLDAFRGVFVNANIKASGSAAGIVIEYNDGGSGGNLLTAAGTSVTLSGTNPSLAINGHSYTLLRTASDLQNLPQTARAGYFALANNIDLNSIANFIPIGNRSPATGGIFSPSSFSGIFDGLGHSITALKINDNSSQDVGLFRVLDGASATTVVRNLSLDGGSITTQAFDVGALAGENLAGTILNVSSSVTINGSNSQGNEGGLVGGNFGTIIDSHASGSVIGTSSVGGLVGESLGTILKSSATGAVSGFEEVGGLAGYANTVSESFATGLVTGMSRPNGGAGEIGGLVGAGGISITNSYATGNVQIINGSSTYLLNPGSTTVGAVGGLAGMFFGRIANSYASGNVTVNDGGTSDYGVGGLLGTTNGTSASGSISQSFATGNVVIYAPQVFGVSVNGIGSLIGQNGEAVTSSYATGLPTVTIVPNPFAAANNPGPNPSLSNIGGMIGDGSGGTFTSAGSIPASTANWDFTNIWYQPAARLPLLRAFQIQPGSSGGGAGNGGNAGGGTGSASSGGSQSSNTPNVFISLVSQQILDTSRPLEPVDSTILDNTKNDTIPPIAILAPPIPIGASAPLPAARLDPTLVKVAKTALPYAELSAAAYGDDLPAGWKAVADYSNFVSLTLQLRGGLANFGATLYFNKAINQYVLAFRGTEPISIRNWMTNIPNLHGHSTLAYQLAVEVAAQVKRVAGDNASVVLTGFSLGGGEAQYASISTGLAAHVFDSAGLNGPASSMSNVSNITNIRLQNDPVSDPQQTFWRGSGRQYGDQYTFPYDVSEFQSHNRSNVIKVLQDYSGQ